MEEHAEVTAAVSAKKTAFNFTPLLLQALNQPSFSRYSQAAMSSFHALEDRIEDGLQPVYPPEASFQPSPWQPIHTNDPPEPPPQDTREADLAALAAQEKLGHDGKRQRVRPRRTVDPFGGLERWKIVRELNLGYGMMAYAVD